MKKTFLTALFAIGFFAVYAQSFTLRGTVVNEDSAPMRGVTVYVQERGRAEVFTNSEGNFQILLPDTTQHKTLVFAAAGYPRQTYRVNFPENDIRFVMKKTLTTAERTTSEALLAGRAGVDADDTPSVRFRGSSSVEVVEDLHDIGVDSPAELAAVEVVAIGYGTSRRADLTGAIAGVETSRPARREKWAESAVAVRAPVTADMASPADSPRRPHPDYPSQSNIKTGTLTSGEVSDFAKWHLWGDILKNDFKQYSAQWNFHPIRRYIAQLTNRQGMPVPNAQVKLMLGNEILWQAKTDNTGKAELWLDFFKQETDIDARNLKLAFNYEGQTTVTGAIPFEQGINTAQIETSCVNRNAVDIFFMVDATGSMSDEIQYLQVELHDIIQKVHAQQSELDLRIGSLVYRDHGDEYLTRKSSLSSDINQTLEFLRAQRAGGGGDYPEAVDVALEESIMGEDWNSDALARILFIILDAPSHTRPEVLERLEVQLRLASELGIRIVPIACSDIKKDGEYLMRTFALATNGTYLFLTDDSGVGNPHIKPTTDKYEVEKLNDAIVRVIKQYTQMPDCDNPLWAEQSKKEEPTDRFVPNPYDERPEKGARELTVLDIISVYPNPCSDILNIDIRRRDVQDIFLIDMSGKVLFGIKTPAREMVNFDVSALATGVYFVRVFYKGRWFSQKVIKH